MHAALARGAQAHQREVMTATQSVAGSTVAARCTQPTRSVSGSRRVRQRRSCLGAGAAVGGEPARQAVQACRDGTAWCLFGGLVCARAAPAGYRCGHCLANLPYTDRHLRSSRPALRCRGRLAPCQRPVITCPLCAPGRPPALLLCDGAAVQDTHLAAQGACPALVGGGALCRSAERA